MCAGAGHARGGAGLHRQLLGPAAALRHQQEAVRGRGAGDHGHHRTLTLHTVRLGSVRGPPVITEERRPQKAE